MPAKSGLNYEIQYNANHIQGIPKLILNSTLTICRENISLQRHLFSIYFLPLFFCDLVCVLTVFVDVSQALWRSSVRCMKRNWRSFVVRWILAVASVLPAQVMALAYHGLMKGENFSTAFATNSKKTDSWSTHFNQLTDRSFFCIVREINFDRNLQKLREEVLKANALIRYAVPKLMAWNSHCKLSLLHHHEKISVSKLQF